MSHNEVYKWFERFFPSYAGDSVEMWFPNGKNSIRVRRTGHLDFVFSYNGPRDWKFETVESFIDGVKKGRT